MKEFIARLTSRKFLIAIAAVSWGIYLRDPDLVKAVVLAYLTAEGLADTVQRYSGMSISELLNKKRQSHNIDDGPDTDGPLVTGSGRVAPSDIEEKPGLTPGSPTPT